MKITPKIRADYAACAAVEVARAKDDPPRAAFWQGIHDTIVKAGASYNGPHTPEYLEGTNAAQSFMGTLEAL